MGFAGLIAALAAPGVMTVGFFIWGELWTGSGILLNALKGILAGLIFMAVIGLTSAVTGSEMVPQVTSDDLFWVWLSSVLGIVLGDTLWLIALSNIGARRVILIDAIKPFLATLLADLMLHEEPSWLLLFGMVVTVAGVLWVALEAEGQKEKGAVSRRNAAVKTEALTGVLPAPLGKAAGPPAHGSCGHVEGNGVARGGCDATSWRSWSRNHCDAENGVQPEVAKSFVGAAGVADKASLKDADDVASAGGSLAMGYAMSALNCAFDVLGFILVKKHARDLSTWHINLVRFGSAGLELGIFIATVAMLFRALGQPPPDWAEVPRLSPRSWELLALGVVFVTVLCPALTQYAIFELDIAVFVTLTSMGPIWALPIGLLVKGEPVTLRALVGSALAVCGVVPLAITVRNSEEKALS